MGRPICRLGHGKQVLFFLLVAVLSVQGQDITNLSGEVVTGFAATKKEQLQGLSRSTVPVSLKFDAKGCLFHPDFLFFHLQPWVSLGEQIPEAGFSGGNGLSVQTVFLRRRAFPLNIRYSKVDRDTLFFNGLAGVRSENSFESLGINWGLHLDNFPEIEVGYSQAESSSKPDGNFLPGQNSDNSGYGLNIKDTLWGWSLRGDYRNRKDNRDRFDVFSPTVVTFATESDRQEVTLQASRSYGANRYNFSGGTRKRNSRVEQFRTGSDNQFFRGTASLQLKEKWYASIFTNYDSNQNDLFGVPVVPFDPLNPFLVPPSQNELSVASVNGQTNYGLGKYWIVSGGAGWAKTHSDLGIGSAVKSNNLNLGGGANYNRTYGWGNFSGGYFLSLSRTPTRFGFTGSRSLGHVFSARAQKGTVDDWELAGTFQYSRNSVDTIFLLTRQMLQNDVSVGKRFGPYVLRGSLGTSQMRIDNSTDLNSNSLTVRAQVEHRLYSLAYNRNTIDSESLIFAPETLPVNPALPPLLSRTILGLSTSQSLTGSWTPSPKLRVTGSWKKIRQSVVGASESLSDAYLVTTRYRFRQLDFDMGFSRYNQRLFGRSLGMRQTFFVKIRRRFVIF